MNERELFNEWLKHYEKHDVKIDQLQRAFMWQAWQASANRQGYKLVPVEPTQNMIDNAVNKTPETPSQDYWHSSQPICDDQAVECYRAMIGAYTK